MTDKGKVISTEELRLGAVRSAIEHLAASAITAPKSGGQLFLRGGKPFMETVAVIDKEVQSRLAEWMRRRGNERREAIWFRDAEATEKMDAILFIGLKDWYPPVYDCGACGYETCAEFLNATKELRQVSAAFEFEGPSATFVTSTSGSRSVRQPKPPRSSGLTPVARPGLPSPHGNSGSSRRTLQSPSRCP